MHILSILLFAVSSSSDNLVVGLSYGARRVSINLINNILVSLISGVGTLLAMSFGKIFLCFISSKHANIIGSCILILFGVYLLINLLRNTPGNVNPKEMKEKNFRYYENSLRNPEIVDTNNSKTIEFKEAITLAIILCLNNIGLGIGASITGLNIVLTSISSLFFSLIFIPTGHFIGTKVLSEKLSKYSEVVSACIIIVLGIYELLI